MWGASGWGSRCSRGSALRAVPGGGAPWRPLLGQDDEVGSSLLRHERRDALHGGVHRLVVAVADLETACAALATELGLELTCRQTDTKGEMIGWVHEAADLGAGVVLNPAGWLHTSVALRGACAQLTAPVVEVHLSNVHAREPFRAHSYISPVASAAVGGMGPEGYLAALRYLAGRLATS